MADTDGVLNPKKIKVFSTVFGKEKKESNSNFEFTDSLVVRKTH